MPASSIDDVATVCVAIFRDISGLKNSQRGNQTTDAQILTEPIETFELDSLSIMEYVMTIEDRFNVELDEKAVNRSRNVGDLVALVAATRHG